MHPQLAATILAGRSVMTDPSRRAPLHLVARLTEFNCGWQDTEIHDGESKAYAASFMLRTVNNLRDHGMDALSWWT